MPRPLVRLHLIIIRFEGGFPLEFDGDDISVVNVVKRELKNVYADPSPRLLETMERLGRPPLVDEVEFQYRAADYTDYTTVVRAGFSGDPDAADHILVRPPQPVPIFPQPPKVIPARDIVPGSTFAVKHHAPQPLAAASKDLQAGWHRSDCTWYFPY